MTETELIILQMEQAFQRRSWHGTNLLGSIRGLRPDEAAWRPQPGRHNIWELILHAAYWKYAVYRRFAGNQAVSFALKGSNFFPRPTTDMSETALKADLSLLKKQHRQLIEAVSVFDWPRLGSELSGRRFTFRDLAVGAAAHDLYHAGQIQLIKRLRRGGD